MKDSERPWTTFFSLSNRPILFENMFGFEFLPESTKTDAVRSLALLIEMTDRQPQEIYKRRFERIATEYRKEKFEEWEKEHVWKKPQ